MDHPAQTAWHEFCDRAMVMPDTNHKAQFLAERFHAKTGESITAAEVEAKRDAYWDWIHSRPVIAEFTIEL